MTDTSVPFDARFELLERLVDQGTGEVWKARDLAVRNRVVAVKILDEVATPSAALDERLRRLKGFRHSAVLAVLHYGVAAGRLYVVQDFFEGASLAAALARSFGAGVLLPRGALERVAEKLCAALDAAHTQTPPLAHGRVSPECVLVRPTSAQQADVRLTDFQLGSSATVSAEGVAADVAGLGSVLRAMCAAPGGGELRRDDVPGAVWSVIERATAPRPEARYRDIDTLARDLEVAWEATDGPDGARTSLPSETTDTAGAFSATALRPNESAVDEAGAHAPTDTVPREPFADPSDATTPGDAKAPKGYAFAMTPSPAAREAPPSTPPPESTAPRDAAPAARRDATPVREAARPTTDLRRGTRLGSFEVISALRSGGMAAIFIGRRGGPAGFSRPVAIKVVHAHLAQDREFLDMFLDEARLSSRIVHPNVVRVEELGEVDGMFYLAMEYVHGVPLSALGARLVKTGRVLSPEVACAIAMHLADGLHAAHEARGDDGEPLHVIHRDISPQNILLSADGQVKLIDFGIAKARGQSQQSSAGSLKGKLRYMSPEQAWGRALDRRTDVYALGVVLWELLVRRPLVDATDEMRALERVRAPAVPPPSRFNPEVTPALDRAVMTALAVRVEDRYESAQAMRRALGESCPGALKVEPDDLAALLQSVVGDELEREKSLLRDFESVRALAAPSDEKLNEALTSLTRQMHASPAPVETPTDAAPETADLRGAIGRAGADPRGGRAPGGAAGAQPGRRRAPWAAALVALVAAGGGGAVWIARTSAQRRAHPAAVRVPAVVSPPGMCSDVQRVIGADDAPRAVLLDTRSQGAGHVALTGLRNPESPPAPEAFVEYRVPGTGPRSVELSTINSGTDGRYDTLLAVFRGPCSPAFAARAPDATFDDDERSREFRSRGALLAQGGETLTVVVTGWGGTMAGRIDRGLVQLDITSRPTHAPTLRAAEVFLASPSVQAHVTATDDDADMTAVQVRFFDAAGEALEVTGAPPAVAAEDGWLGMSFDRPTLGASSLDETAVGLATDGAALERAVTATVSVRDEPGNASAPLRVPVVRGAIVGPGLRCDATHRCAAELICGAGGVCQATGLRLAACAAAQPLAIELDAAGVGHASRQGVITPGPGQFAAPCLSAASSGNEDVYQVTVPPGAWDLIATTDNHGTAGASRLTPDTVLYFRRGCTDATPASAPRAWCSDDIVEMQNLRSRVEIRDVPPGELFAFVEIWISAVPDAVGERYELDLTLRPVVAAGAACDPRGERSRCAGAPCDATTARCP